MFVRCKKRFKDGKEHRYWSVGENVRVSGGRVCSAKCWGHQKVCSYDYGKEASSLGSTLWVACCGSVSSPRRPPVSSYFIVFGAIGHFERWLLAECAPVTASPGPGTAGEGQTAHHWA